MSEQDSTLPSAFRVIPGYPRYAIDESGTVLSICFIGRMGKNRLWSDATRVKPLTDSGGYQFVRLTHDGCRRRIFVHRLVLLTFVSPCPDGMQCRHLDGNKDNNHVSNLEWGTKSQNERDKILHGTFGIGEDGGNAKLKTADVLEIRRRAANGERTVDIAKDFTVHPGHISYIVLRKSWKHI